MISILRNGHSYNIIRKLICNANINTKIFLTFVQIFKGYNEAIAHAHGTILPNMYSKTLMFFFCQLKMLVLMLVFMLEWNVTETLCGGNVHVNVKGLTKDNTTFGDETYIKDLMSDPNRYPPKLYEKFTVLVIVQDHAEQLKCSQHDTKSDAYKGFTLVVFVHQQVMQCLIKLNHFTVH